MTTRYARVTAAVAISMAGLVLAGCGGTGSATSPRGNSPTNASNAKSINVVLPMGPVAGTMWKPFESKYGIHVNYTNVEWGSLQTKIAAAAEANTYFADVTNVDWSKVGQYTKTKWFKPLNQLLNTKYLKHNSPAMSAFIDKSGTYYGIPQDTQFLVTTINVDDLKKAGISTMPKTLGEYTNDLKQIKAKGIVKYPLGIPLSAAEYLSTYWYEVTNAFGGSPLTCNYTPTFGSPSSAGYRAVQWIVNAYKSGLVPPGDINSIVNPVEAELAHNQVASIFSDYSGNIAAIYNNKSQSSVIGQIRYINTPGINGIANNFTDPDGLGIPVTAKNTQGAVDFLKWFNTPQEQLRFAANIGEPGNALAFPLYEKSFPGVRQADLDRISKDHARPVFSCGAPPWYAAFSQAVNTNIHAAAAGQKTVASAVNAIYTTTESLRRNG